MHLHRYVLIALIVLLPAGPFATTFPVTKTDDTNDGMCDADCSLREAIDAANTNPGADDVPVPAGTFLWSWCRGVQFCVGVKPGFFHEEC